MIITYSKHGRTSRDSAKLIAHLLKPENDHIEILDIGNSVAADLPGVIRDMEIFRNGSSAAASFHHLSINPSIDYSKEQLLLAADAVRAELDRDDTRPWIVIAHTKARQNSTEGHVHAHLVLGHVDGAGRALKDGRAKIRTEVVARTLEFQNSETPLLSRHHQTVVKFLREREREDVADWLIAAHGPDPEEPKSAYGSKAREAAKRRGINLPHAKSDIDNAWSGSKEIDSFQAKLKALGYRIEPGKKDNVWIVVDSRGNVIGALDRLLKLRRHAVKQLMENQDGSDKGQHRPSTNDHRPRPETVREIGRDRRANRTVEAAADPATNPAGSFRRGSCQSHHLADGTAGRPFQISDRRTTSHRFEAGLASRNFERQRALSILRKIGQRVSGDPRHWTLSDDHMPDLPFDWNATDLWGIALQRSPREYRPL